ncbi:DNA photolyase family protein [Antarcticibacterium sp. 1MA-6-2]|uniref:cryptochrome/photolyase family protein n=1 Tax=Antarcticibacterium sp. 1MA-6-2 TaxID=2908210 RepID=UPI001F28E43E|nr:deoxyribodipyrimidine photo-lyase [Antarcticibacterium sp. 1MA-6-2]UJH91510.1 DNA photolyase family protein [Antarcticibacterium sp. 1MA-6-2]
MEDPISIFWFRRDLRLEDNVGFFHALNNSLPVLLSFIFDTEILDSLPEDDARVTFIHQILQKLRYQLQEYHSSIALYHGKPKEIFKQLQKDYNIKKVFTNHDYEPYARKRDRDIAEFLASEGIEFQTYKDQVIFEKNEIVKKDGDPYVVYSPYMRLWKERLKANGLEVFDSKVHFKNLIQHSKLPDLSLSDIGFTESQIKVPELDVSPSRINEYEAKRNDPAAAGTSHLGPHLRFGTVGIRTIVAKAVAEPNETFLQELIWREFFMQILWHYPQTVTEAFKPQYDRIKWRNNEEEFKMWKMGKMSYALVDAGMRQLNATGFMHNRVRMLVASFLCKHLLIDWRWGEAYFAEKLLDYELASNVGNWQWGAGSGVDAAPYFRIFNPMTQAEKFDKDNVYIKKWIREYNTSAYPAPIVDHKEARERALRVYKEGLS